MEEPIIGVFVCWCGTNIAKMVDVEWVAEEIKKLPDVVVSKNYKYMCSDPGQELIINEIKENNLNRIVVAACSPRIHELTFRKALENAGLNSYLFEMANIREQVSWVHNNREEATKKARSLVAAAVNRVAFHEPLDKREVEVNPATLVLGGGIAGLTVAVEIADAGLKVYLIEKREKLGGNMANINLMYPQMDSARQSIDSLINYVEKHPNIEIYTTTILEEVFGYVGNFETVLPNKTKLNFGNIIVATGLKTFDPSRVKEYKYKELKDVITSVEFEKILQNGEIRTHEGKNPRNIAIIHCVGSRNANHNEYCSRTCCMTALKYSNQISAALPQANIFELYADMRAFGKGCEELYASTSRKNIIFMMFDQQEGLPVISKASDKDSSPILINMYEKLSGEQVEIPVDMVILMVGVEAHEDAKDLSHVVGISMCGNNFYIEKHPKLDPVATTTDGVYIVGSCQAPKGIIDSISQARAAASRVLASIARGSIQVEVTTAVVNEEVCCGCQTCISVCPYKAISFDEEKKVSVVNEILCKGCGTCGSTCPTGAIRSRHFTDQQILSQIEGLLTLSLQEV